MAARVTIGYIKYAPGIRSVQFSNSSLHIETFQFRKTGWLHEQDVDNPLLLEIRPCDLVTWGMERDQ